MFDIDWYDLERLLNTYDFIDEFDAKIIADYLDECGSDLNLTGYIWNTVAYNVVCLKGGKEEALRYIEEELGCSEEDCTIYVSETLGGVYLEWS